MTFPFPTIPAHLGIGGNDEYTTLLLHAEGANGGTTFVDSSRYNHSVGVQGSSVTTSNVTSKFGSTSIRLPATGGLLIPHHDSLSMGLSDFTIDLWAYASGYKFQNPFSKGFTFAGGLLIQFHQSGPIYLYMGSQTIQISSSTLLSTGSWIHYALVRQGSLVSLYMNGVRTGQVSALVNLNNTEPLMIGARYAAADNYFNGYIDEFRISKGIARWTGPFIPNVLPYH